MFVFSGSKSLEKGALGQSVQDEAPPKKARLMQELEPTVPQHHYNLALKMQGNILEQLQNQTVQIERLSAQNQVYQLENEQLKIQLAEAQMSIQKHSGNFFKLFCYKQANTENSVEG